LTFLKIKIPQGCLIEASLVPVKLLNSGTKIFAVYISILINSHCHGEISENIVRRWNLRTLLRLWNFRVKQD